MIFAMTNIRDYHSSTENKTDTIGSALAAVLQPGTVIALVGNLGAGKTRLTRAICTGMEVDARDINSPTFVLIQEYAGRLPLYHFDTYRLNDTDEFLELGADELLDGEGVCFVEWADRVADVLPKDLIRIEIEITGETSRLFHISATGPKSQRMIDQLPSEIK
ncbi:tRNA threonylcarbamoyladenosine biosynthesis protein TsaE [hydrothermal vent metagenome]|uniref:tRNA threonylcarbamoyladenosine biosynthesis protein TsaE n=1 Tax=hydrothermal vent metagenome TaxID=652676 RepID=A0A3B1DJG9_9ZZZZ